MDIKDMLKAVQDTTKKRGTVRYDYQSGDSELSGAYALFVGVVENLNGDVELEIVLSELHSSMTKKNDA